MLEKGLRRSETEIRQNQTGNVAIPSQARLNPTPTSGFRRAWDGIATFAVWDGLETWLDLRENSVCLPSHSISKQVKTILDSTSKRASDSRLKPFWVPSEARFNYFSSSSQARLGQIPSWPVLSRRRLNGDETTSRCRLRLMWFCSVYLLSVYNEPLQRFCSEVN